MAMKSPSSRTMGLLSTACVTRTVTCESDKPSMCPKTELMRCPPPRQTDTTLEQANGQRSQRQPEDRQGHLCQSGDLRTASAAHGGRCQNELPENRDSADWRRRSCGDPSRRVPLGTAEGREFSQGSKRPA